MNGKTLRDQAPDRPPRSLSPTVEDYLMTIYSLEQKEQEVTGTRVAERLHVSRPTVVGMVRRLERDSLLHMDVHKHLHLTGKGQETAAGVVRRHFLAERMLTELLGIPWYQVHEEAHRLEHAISPEVEKRLIVVLGQPQTCPHGNPIPGMGYSGPRGVPLTQMAVGQKAKVVRITEEIEDEAEALDFLNRYAIRPGAHILVQEISPSNQTLTVGGEGGSVTMGWRLAQEVWVAREAPRPS
jgi:DtxR family Mn-dependent transcriptional regulator